MSLLHPPTRKITPENHSLNKENHLPNLHDLGFQPFVFGGVSPLQGGPLRVINGVITPIMAKNKWVTGVLSPRNTSKWSYFTLLITGFWTHLVDQPNKKAAF